MNRHFVVYKSSAGSGKTTTLVKEYLKLTLLSPGIFRNILAITFTNKAANEMKSKIIESLQAISSGRLDKSNYGEIMEETNLSEERMIQRARQLLSLIIHHYDEFAVSTIDAFVHRIVRTFTADLKLPQGFEVIIDNDDLIPFIVEDLYDKLGHDDALTEILLHYVMSQVDDEKSYDLTKNLSGFIKKQLTEDVQGNSDKAENISSAEFLQSIHKLRDAVFSAKKAIQKEAVQNLELIANAGLSIEDFFHGKNGVGGYLKKLSDGPAGPASLLPNNYVVKAIEEDVWYSATKSNNIKTRIDGIKPQLRAGLTSIREKISFYAIRQLVYNNIYEMALMGEIRRLFEDFTGRTRKVHISEFNKRIHHEIADQPVPFIYERLGRRYRYFLIDEFQDTSILQWSNLLPLVEESLAGGHFNMVAGDAKQAIYRFRNGEVELFTHLPHLYGMENSAENIQRSQTLERNYVPKDLKTNYRSREEIIRFNNDFFSLAGKGLTGSFDEIYKDVEQQVPAKKKEGGYVAIDFVPSENAADFKEKRLVKIRETVERLSEKGYPLKDICILTLDNASAAEAASSLLQHNIPVVSSESMLLTSSAKVRLTVAFMKLINQPGNRLFLAEFLINLLWINHATDKFQALYTEAVAHAHPVQFILGKFGLSLPANETLRLHTVYEMAAEIIRNLTNTKTPDIFLQFFQDFIFEKEPVYNGSLPAFLQLWEEKKENEGIVIPHGINAVQIMTAHKAKGLKFGVVIADLHAMQNRLTRKQYWEDISLQELGDISPVLLNINDKELKAVGREEVYTHERAKTDLDFLNKIYVAFTRAVDGLFLIGSRLQNNSTDYFSKKLVAFLSDKGLWDDEKIHYTWGAFPETATDNNLPPAHESTITLSENYNTPWYEYLDIAPVEEVYWEAIGQQAQRTFGKLVHAILSKINYPEEAGQQVDAFQYAGLLDAQESIHIKKVLHRLLSHPQLERYYSKEVSIKTETELYDKETAQFLRPDRVVVDGKKLTIIDYKTGKREAKTEKKYQNQVTGYASLFARLGYQDIEKKLVYINDENVEVVPV